MKFVKSRRTLKRRIKRRKMNSSKRAGNPYGNVAYGNVDRELSSIVFNGVVNAASHLSKDDPIRKKTELICELLKQLMEDITGYRPTVC